MSWLERQPGVKVNKKLVTTAGISMGGAIAAALATRYNVFRTGMVIHSPCVQPPLCTLIRAVRGLSTSSFCVHLSFCQLLSRTYI